MPSKIVYVRVRMPRDLHKKIQRGANQNGQTINAEILYRLSLAEKTPELLNSLGLLSQMVREIREEALPRIERLIYEAASQSAKLPTASNIDPGTVHVTAYPTREKKDD